MKLLIIALLLSFTSLAQNPEQTIRSNTYLPTAIEIGPLPVLKNSDVKLSLSYVALESEAFIELSGTGWGVATISKDNEAIFLFSNDSTVTVKSTEVQSFDADSGTYKHRYAINPADIEKLSRYSLIGIRKYNFRDFSDLAIPRQKADPIKNLSAAFLKELSKRRNDKSARL